MIINLFDRFFRLIQPIQLSIDPLTAGAISFGASALGGLFGGDDEIEVPDRNLRDEVGAGLSVREDFVDDALDLESTTRRGIAGIDVQSIGDVLFRGGDNLGTFIPKLARESADLREELDTRSRQALLNDVGRFGIQFRDQVRSSNPELFNLIEQNEGRTLNNLGPTDVSQRIATERARRLGRGLTPREEAELTEGIRQGASDRGLFRGNQALLNEAIALTEADRGRLIQNENLALASDIDLRQQRAEDDARVGRLIGTRQATFFNPISTVAGIRSPDAIDTGARLGLASGIAGSAASGLTTNPIIDPNIASFFNQQFEAQTGAAAADAEISAARTGGVTDLLGTAGIELIKKGL